MRDGAYLIGLQGFVKDTLKADRIISNTSVLRLPGRRANQVAVLLVHCDFTPKSARRLLAECWDQTLGWRDWQKRKSSSPNRWRVRAKPIAAIVASLRSMSGGRSHSLRTTFRWLSARQRSLSEADVQVADFIEEVEGSPPYQDELSLCHYSPRHEWYNFSDMTPDEILLFIGYDYARPQKCGAMHTAFRDPTCPPGVSGRASIEVRMFAFFE